MPVEKIPSWIERLLMPKLSEIGGDIKVLDAKIESFRNETKTEIEGLRKEMLSRFESVDSKFAGMDIKIDSLRNETKMEIASLRTEMTVRLDSLEKRIPVIEEITALKLKIAEIEKRLALA